MATRGRTIPAVILAAGDGGRLGFRTANLPKPLVPLGDRPLIEYTLGALSAAGVEEAIVVTGFLGEQLESELRRRRPARPRLTFVHNTRYRRGASYSLCAARPLVEDRPFVLTMADHLLSGELLTRLLDCAEAEPGHTLVAADSSERSSRYTDEATKLTLDATGRVTAMGKHLPHWSVLDTGAFVVTPSAWDAVDAVTEDCELGVIFSEVARRGELYAADVSGAFWYDVDTEEDLAEAMQLVGAPEPVHGADTPVTLSLESDPATV